MVVETTGGEFRTRYLINCAGLHSDKIIRMAGGRPSTQIIPFRGEYYEVIPERRHLVRALIYPVPDTRFPFLEVHFTKRVDGRVDAGPNAVLVFKREGYRRRDLSLRDIAAEFSFPGFWRMSQRYWRMGLAELHRSFSQRAFVRELQRLVPEANSSDFVPGDTGVRAQAVHVDGSLLDDFHFKCSRNMIHICNVPSPAATASIPIGKAIVQMASENFGLG
jgi:L-2-hydroxyglutarate oxidase